MFGESKRRIGLSHLYVWVMASVVPMFLSVMQCANYNEIASEGKSFWEVLLIVVTTQAGPFVGLVADPEGNHSFFLNYAAIAGAMLLVSLTSFLFLKPSPNLFWKVLAWVFYVLAVLTWFVLGQVALQVALQ